MVLKCKLTFAHELGSADGAVEEAASARQSEAGRVGRGGRIPCCAHGVTRVARDLAVDTARVVEARGCGAGAVARFSCAGGSEGRRDCAWYITLGGRMRQVLRQRMCECVVRGSNSN